MVKTWDEFRSDTAHLAEQIQSSGFCPSMLIAIARGGFIPTRLLSSALKVNRLGAFGVKYIDSSRGDLTWYHRPETINRDERILLVEDCLESGWTLYQAAKFASEFGCTVQTCSVYELASTKHRADFVGLTVEVPPQLPWE